VFVSVAAGRLFLQGDAGLQAGTGEEVGMGMESPDATRDATPETGDGQKLMDRGRPQPHLRTTRGGAGSTAGATPKKAYRPSASSRSRPAGKKPDTLRP
jgi:hypothetical protein